MMLEIASDGTFETTIVNLNGYPIKRIKRLRIVVEYSEEDDPGFARTLSIDFHGKPSTDARHSYFVEDKR